VDETLDDLHELDAKASIAKTAMRLTNLIRFICKKLNPLGLGFPSILAKPISPSSWPKSVASCLGDRADALERRYRFVIASLKRSLGTQQISLTTT
jgi:hypothetical protein